MIENKFNPLVSVLIPTYNRPHYLQVALDSALNQTYKNIEIIICDDSTNDDTTKMIEPYLKKYKNIKYYYNGGPLGLRGTRNSQKCLELSSGKYINYLHDDDVFHPDKIKIMVECICKYENVTMVVGANEKIGWKREPILYLPVENLVVKRKKGVDLIKSFFRRFANVVGAPTGVLFDKKYIDRFGVFGGRQHRILEDVAMWLVLCSKGDCIRVNNILSYRRIHGGQNAVTVDRVTDLVEWIYLVENAYKTGLLTEEEYNAALQKWKVTFSKSINIIKQNPKYKQYKQEIEKFQII
ncbi:glycosyltransferase family 2 protein [Clostridium ganghwense]|uniref:Glycosyltransferase family A protein n=1 Tax=Clostridium ganghwense TaxID=312089 RepID=A0ABT4CNA6_9CLOT|nr:glycosyltransferase family A protein [Clostridium ganghwense]MCY6370539.1 glycosyltransferase family A protein [Clostridium ganghwense]